MAHIHRVYDTDYHFLIDPITRVIRNLSEKITLIQYDHNSERFTFEIPRYVDGHDMSLCNKSEIHFSNMGRGQVNPGMYSIDDLEIDKVDDNVVICSWLISRDATQLVGRLAFVVRFACVSGDVKADYAWHTLPYTDINIAQSIYNYDVMPE